MEEIHRQLEEENAISAPIPTSQPNICTYLENEGGWCTSIAIGPDGLPVISYQDRTTHDLRVCKCGFHSCSD